MQGTKPYAKTTRSYERFLAVVGAIVCVITCVRIWQVLQLDYSPGGPQPIWPLPGLYLLEMVAAGLIGAFSVVNAKAEQSPIWGAVTWAVAGVLVAFVVMGAWSIGLLFLPAALIFTIVAILSDRRRSQSIVVHLGIGVMAGLAQVAVMLAVVRWLYPNAVF